MGLLGYLSYANSLPDMKKTVARDATSSKEPTFSIAGNQ